MSKKIVGFSGGKDSTALVLRMQELGEEFDELLFTPTGRELPDCIEHIGKVQQMVGRPIVSPPGPTLEELMQKYDALPNWRQRWCTRQIKILPCIDYLKKNAGSTLFVGLRADEEQREGIYGDFAAYRYPLREWGWGIRDVIAYNKSRDVKVPARTDCDWCYGQRLGEWYRLWKNNPDKYAEGEAWETKTGHTFRSPGRDTWPAGLVQLRIRFEKGDKPRGVDVYRDMEQEACRVCKI